MSVKQEIKVLPFEGKQGPVPGHAITTYQYKWFGDKDDIHLPWITAVVFECWDDEAKISTSVIVRISELTRWTKRKWPSGGQLRAVVLSSGHRLPCDARYARHAEGEYEKAPILARDMVYGVTGGHVVFEISGVIDWLASPRRPEDASLIIDPWERDNREYQERMAALSA